MEDFSEKVKISDNTTTTTTGKDTDMLIDGVEESERSTKSSKTADLLRRFLDVQQRRAETYARLRRGFTDYMVGGGDLAYQQLCRDITLEFNDCSKQVLEIESMFLKPDFSRSDLADLLRSVQTHEKEKLHLTVTIQVLKKAGRPSERLVSHEHCKFKNRAEHECVHVHEITVDAGTEEAEADAEYDAALKEAIRAVQDAITSINEYIEEVRYEMEALQTD